MLKKITGWMSVAAIGLFLLAGCNNNAASDATSDNGASSSESGGADTGDASNPADSTSTETSDAASAADDAGTEVALSPENTTITFIGTHTGNDPNPREGTFTDFTGTLTYDPASGKLQKVKVTIQAASLNAQIPKLTNHLQSVDFLDVNEYPTIEFVSTGIESKEGNQYSVTGDLMLHGVTKQITIPVEFDAAGTEPKLASEFQIDRTEYGITYGEQQVVKIVSLRVAVNDDSAPEVAPAGDQ